MKWNLLGIVSNLNFSKKELGKGYTMPKGTVLEIFYRKIKKIINFFDRFLYFS